VILISSNKSIQTDPKTPMNYKIFIILIFKHENMLELFTSLITIY
jgi:hypothetical protein